MLGVCEVCGALATQFSRNVFVEIPFDGHWAEKMSPGELHRRCADHPHKSTEIVLREGPMAYEARMEREMELKQQKPTA
jgi:hypothetical protein